MAAETSSQRVINQYQRERLRKFGRSIRHNTKAVVGLALIIGLVVLAIVSPMIISEQATNQMNVQDRFAAPSPEHPFGTDNFGRDVFARTLPRVRISLYVGLSSVLISSAVGVPPAGSPATPVAPSTTSSCARWTSLMSFPPILVAMTITAVIGPTLNNAILALGLVYIPYFARVTRSEAISVAQEEFVEAAEALGERDSYILFREVLPNAAAPIIVQASISISFAILAAAGLSFLGLGAQPPTPSWD